MDILPLISIDQENMQWSKRYYYFSNILNEFLVNGSQYSSSYIYLEESSCFCVIITIISDINY